MLTTHVKMKLIWFGLTCKDPEQLETVPVCWSEMFEGVWHCKGEAWVSICLILLCSGMFSFSEETCGSPPNVWMAWCHVVTDIIKWSGNVIIKSWDDDVTNILLRQMMETVAKVKDISQETTVWMVGNECMGWFKFPGFESSVRAKQQCTGRWVLVVSNEWCPRH